MSNGIDEQLTQQRIMNKYCNYNNAWNAKTAARGFLEDVVGGNLAFVPDRESGAFHIVRKRELLYNAS